MNQDSTPRRRFLTGTASLPVILTLQSGSALAAVSNTCRVNDARKADPVLFENSSTAGGADEWVRSTINLVTLTVDGQPYSGPSGKQVFFQANDFYYEYQDDATPPVLLNGVAAPRPGAPNVQETALLNGERRVLVHVDDSGRITGFAWDQGAGGQKLTGSCWTSFA